MLDALYLDGVITVGNLDHRSRVQPRAVVTTGDRLKTAVVNAEHEHGTTTNVAYTAPLPTSTPITAPHSEFVMHGNAPFRKVVLQRLESNQEFG